MSIRQLSVREKHATTVNRPRVGPERLGDRQISGAAVSDLSGGRETPSGAGRRSIRMISRRKPTLPAMPSALSVATIAAPLIAFAHLHSGLGSETHRRIRPKDDGLVNCTNYMNEAVWREMALARTRHCTRAIHRPGSSVFAQFRLALTLRGGHD